MNCEDIYPFIYTIKRNKSIGCFVLAYKLIIRGTMKMRKKKSKKKILILVILISMIFFMALTGIVINLSKKDLSDNYFIIDEDLYYKNKIFARDEGDFSVMQLDKQIGVTDEKQQVFSIKDEDPNKWICLRIDGNEYIYREIHNESKPLNLENFSVDRIIIKDQFAAGGYKITINTEKEVKQVLSYMQEKNLVKFPENSVQIKELVLSSNLYPGFIYKLLYLHDEEDDNCFLYDSNTDELWQIGHELMEYI